MIIIIDIGDQDTKDNRILGNYVHFGDNQVLLDGTFHVIGRFEVLGVDKDNEPNVIRELPSDWRPEDRIEDPT